MQGHISKAVHDNGGKVTGIIPTAFNSPEVMTGSVGEILWVNGMHERKAMVCVVA